MKASKPDHIYMDAMGFGMGNCCLQVLFLREALCPPFQLPKFASCIHVFFPKTDLIFISSHAVDLMVSVH